MKYNKEHFKHVRFCYGCGYEYHICELDLNSEPEMERCPHCTCLMSTLIFETIEEYKFYFTLIHAIGVKEMLKLIEKDCDLRMFEDEEDGIWEFNSRENPEYGLLDYPPNSDPHNDSDYYGDGHPHEGMFDE